VGQNGSVPVPDPHRRPLPEAGGRGTYHHGDLANALTAAATDLARRGGPEAVVLREAARQVGVSATAAYRHFSGYGDLVHAVKEWCQQTLAASMRSAIESGDPLPDPGAEAVRRLRAIGDGYIRFALAEPGLYRTCFTRSDRGAEVRPEHSPEAMRDSPAFGMLYQSFVELAAVGLLPPGRLPLVESVAAWSTAHGLAMLLLDGPLAGMPERERAACIQRTLDMVVDGLVPRTSLGSG
jgi:AcrR family transcriptional regulator